MDARTDPLHGGLARGCKVFGAKHAGAQALPGKIICDVAIVSAGITAELLSRAGLDVSVLEEGLLKTSSDFHQLESEAHPSLYQESAARKTADKAINILQGRCVGGSTTVNWTRSFVRPTTRWLIGGSTSRSPTIDPRRSRPGLSRLSGVLASGPGWRRRTRTTICSSAAP